MFKIKHEYLQKLCEINSFNIPKDQLVFFGLRGCQQVDEDNNSNANEISFSLSNIDYTSLNCTILQWNVKNKSIAAFAASTVPHKKYLKGHWRETGKGLIGYLRECIKIIKKDTIK